MAELTLHFVAAIPVGHRIQIVRAQRWGSPIFSSAPATWMDIDVPILVDLDTGIVWTAPSLGSELTLAPLGFKPNKGCRVAQTEEARVTSCLVAAMGGDRAEITTTLVFDPLPAGYRT
jgi:hypothetical protein